MWQEGGKGRGIRTKVFVRSLINMITGYINKLIKFEWKALGLPNSRRAQ